MYVYVSLEGAMKIIIVLSSLFWLPKYASIVKTEYKYEVDLIFRQANNWHESGMYNADRVYG